MPLTQRQQVLKAVIEFCESRNSRSFELDEFQVQMTPQLARSGNWTTKTPQATVRRLFQELRDKDEVISFVDNRGLYTLRGAILLNFESDGATDDFSKHGMEETQKTIGRFVRKPRRMTERQEYIRETYYRRDAGLVEWAKNFHGCNCMICKCGNRFTKPNGQPYIEAHHIIPLCEDGRDVEENLSLICAHHHRMAHFADDDSKKDIRTYLLKEVDARLRA